MKEAFEKIIEAIQADPTSAVGMLAAATELVEGVRCRGKVRNLPHITVDEPPHMGGSDAGPNPVEILLVALGTCQEISYAVTAALMGIDLKKVKVFVEGSIDLRGALGMDEEVSPDGNKHVVATLALLDAVQSIPGPHEFLNVQPEYLILFDKGVQLGSGRFKLNHLLPDILFIHIFIP